MEAKHTALVTGASGGIGTELARLFAADGHDLVLVGRRRDRLDALASELAARHHVRCTVLARDLARAGEGTAVFGEIESLDLDISVLVNNAGFATYGPFAGTDLQRQLDLLRVNIEALTELTWRSLPGMIEKRRGHVLNVASTAAFQPGPLMAVYYASKAYVLSFSEAIAEETRGTGVTVTALCPGPVATGFQAAAEMDGARLLRVPGPDAAAVARAAYAGMWRGRRVVVPGALNRLAAQAYRVLPRGVMTRIVRRLNER